MKMKNRKLTIFALICITIFLLLAAVCTQTTQVYAYLDNSKYLITFDYVAYGTAGASSSGQTTGNAPLSSAFFYTSGGTQTTVKNNAVFEFSPQYLEVNVAPYITSVSYSIESVEIKKNSSTIWEDKTSVRSGSSRKYTLPSLSNGNYSLHLLGYTSAYGRALRTTYEFNFSISLDSVPPSVSANVQNNAYTNQEVLFTAKDSGSGVRQLFIKKPDGTTGAVSGSSYSIVSGSLNGWYEVVAEDKEGNRSTAYKVYYDNTAPVVFSEISNKGFTNNQFIVTAFDVNLQSFYVKEPTASSFSELTGSTFKLTKATNGAYEFYAIDKAGNTSEIYTIYYDTVAPTLTLVEVGNNGYTNSTVRASWSSNGQLINSSDALIAKYSISKTKEFPTQATTTFSSEKTFTEEGNYLVQIEDKAGNYTEYRFTIDKTAPELLLNGVTPDGFTNGSVKAFWITTVDGTGSALTNSQDKLTVRYSRSSTSAFPVTAETEYVAGTALTEEGNYLFRIEDSANNYTEYRFTIDNTAPVLTLNGVTPDGFTNGSVKASWSTTVEGVGAALTNSRDKLTVRYSRSSTAAFPVTTETEYVAGTALTEEGNYLFRIEDSANNYTEYRITIDNTAPVLTLNGVTSDGFTNGSVKASWSTTVGGVGAALTNSRDKLTVRYSRSSTAAFPSTAETEYVAGTTLLEEGNYLFRIEDSSNNYTEYRFTIDVTAPLLSFQGTSQNEITKLDVTLIIDRTTLGVGSQLMNDADALVIEYAFSTTGVFPTKTTQIYEEGTVLTSVGNYFVTIRDSSGNVSSYKFSIDKSAPTLNLYGVANEGFTKGSVYANWSLNVGGANSQLINSNDTLTVCYAFSKNENFPTIATHEYRNNTDLSEEGNYLVRIEDKAGNYSEYRFTIDSTAPTLTLVGTLNSHFTNGDVQLTWSRTVGGVGSALVNNRDTLSVTYGLSTTKEFPTTTTEPCSIGMLLSNEGNYLVEIVDRCGNKTSYRFSIDKTAPIFQINDVRNGGFSNKSVTVLWQTTIDGVGSPRINLSDRLTVLYAVSTAGDYPTTASIPFANGAKISTVGNYLFWIFDASNNVTEYRFTIDTTAPELALFGLNSNSFSNNSVYATWDSLVGGVNTQLCNENDRLIIRFARSETKEFPTITTNVYMMSESLTLQGNYLFRIEDSSNNYTEYRFTIDNTAPVLTLNGVTPDGFTNGSVKASWSTTVEGVGAALTNSRDKLTVRYSRSSTAAFPSTAETEYVAGTTLLEEGNYLFRIEDSSNNYTEYRFTIDKTAPELLLNGVTPGGFTNGSVKAFWITTVDGTGSALTNSQDKLTVRYSRSSTAAFPVTAETEYVAGTALTEEGNYLFRIEDSSNNYLEQRFTIDNTAPVLTLNGVTSDGFTNGSVKASWSTTVEGVGAALTNSRDKLTVRYSRSSTAAFPSTAETEYVAGTALTEEGNYLFRIEDSSNNYLEQRFTIDNTAPVLTLNGVTSDGFTNGSVKASWSTTVGGVGAALTNSRDKLTVRYSRSSTAAFPSTAETEYVAGTALTEEGNYLFRIEDSSNNYLEQRFTIDNTAPVLDILGLVKENASKNGVSVTWSLIPGGVSSVLTNTQDKLTVTYTRSDNSFPLTANSLYTRGTVLSIEGYYLICVVDKSGNVTEYRVIVDCTAPTVADVEPFTNTSFVFSAKDPRNVTIEYRQNNGEIRAAGAEKVAIDGNSNNYGMWQFRAIDDVGNATSWYSVGLYRRDTFGNVDKIKNGFKVVTWYSVKLVTRYFHDAAGTYSFADYDNALAFAVSKEFEYRVEALAGGRWSYVNISNETVSQIYDNRSDLDKAVLKYAKTYVSDRNIFSLNGNSYQNPTDGDFISRDDALTVQNVVLPEHLIQYADLPLYLISHRYAFMEPLAGVSGNNRTICLKYLSDGTRPQTSETLEIAYGQSIQSVLDEVGAWRQGYYLVTEQDLCKNVEYYIVCVDSEAPTMTGEVVYGNGSNETILFDREYTKQHENVMLYTRFDIQSFSDAIDEFSLIGIKGAGLNALYTQLDLIPILTYDNGFSGKYTITVYDRSLNTLEFVIRIAGEAPRMTYTSLTNETKCTLRVVCDDVNNAVTSIQLFQISYTGEYTQILTDSDGTPITAENLTYVLRTGGKYVMKFVDVYGRELETDPIFYLKGLPSGILHGVKEGGISNTDVTLEYSPTHSVILYVWSNGQWIQNTSNIKITEKEGFNVASVVASAENSLQYKFFLFATEDRNLFVEYRFEIDCIAPAVSIIDQNGNQIENNTVTKESFRVSWDEYNITAYYYSASDSMGELGETKYTKDKIISKPGTYIFTISDKVGNKTLLNVTLDNNVSFTVNGNYSILSDGSYIAKNYMVLTVTERTASFLCEASNGISIENGQRIDVDGTYRITVTDMYGNVAIITLIIDNLPPVPIIKTIQGIDVVQNGIVNQPFLVSCLENGVSIVFSYTGVRYEPYDGERIEAEGTYYFKLTDRMNNLLVFTVTLDVTVDFSVKGTFIDLGENRYISRTGITIVSKENYKRFDVSSENDVTFKQDEKIAVEGIYTVTIEDMFYNNIIIVVIIDKTPPTPKIETEHGESVTPNGKTNRSFVVFCTEEQSTLTYSRTSSGFVPYKGVTLTELGVYYFNATDLIGNSLIFTVEIDKEVKYSVSGDYLEIGDHHYLLRIAFTLTVNESYLSFDVKSTAGSFNPGDKVSKEGVYLARIEDAANNVVVVTLELDKTPPVPTIQTEQGIDILPNGRTNQSFRVTSERDAEITVSQGGGKAKLYGGELLAEASLYTFEIVDRIGNKITFTILIDTEVDYRIIGTYKEIAAYTFITQNGISIELKEDCPRFSVTSDNGSTFIAGEKITKEGHYTVVISDTGENTVTLLVIVDRTPPIPVIRTEQGEEVSPNGKTNQPFRVTSEQGAEITVSWNGAKFEPYNGEIFKNIGTYSFVAIDIVGNSATFNITLDIKVDFALKGNYKQLSDNYFVSASWIRIEAKEEFKRFNVENVNGLQFSAGEQISVEGVYVVTIEDGANNVVIITIEIDKTAPTPIIRTQSGKIIDLNSVTNESFTVSCEENNVTLLQSANGINYVAYVGESLEKSGLYYFRFNDFIGNQITFTVRIDGQVDFEVRGTYVLEDVNSYLSRTGVTITVKEEIKRFDVVSNNGITFAPGEKISVEGIYTVTIADLGDNVIQLRIRIDQTPPILLIKTQGGKNVLENSKIKEAFQIESSEEKSVITVSTNGTRYEPYNGELLTEEGKYYVRIADFAENAAECTVEIDKHVDYTIKGNFLKLDENSYISSSGLTVILNEDIVRFEERGGALIQPSVAITQENNYLLFIEDEAENNIEIIITIDKTSPIAVIYTEQGSELLPDTKTNQSFTVSCAEEGAVILVSTNGIRYNPYDGTLLTEEKCYFFQISDLVGNSTFFTVTIDRRIDYSLKGDFKETENGYLTRTGIVVLCNEQYERFDIFDADGVEYDPLIKLSVEGIYTVTIGDKANNRIQFTVVVDQSSPTCEIRITDGVVSPNGTTNQPFSVTCEEEGVVILWSRSGSRYENYSGATIDESGVFYFTVSDRIGNENSFTVTLDLTVDYFIRGTYTEYEPRSFASRFGLIIDVKEEIQSFDVTNDNGITFAQGEKVTQDGIYFVRIKDTTGNEVLLKVVIDTVAPVIELSGVSDGDVTNQSVTLIGVDEDANLTYFIAGVSGAMPVTIGAIFESEAKYTLVARDFAGNETRVLFEIDKHVSMTVNPLIYENQIITDAVSFVFSEPTSELIVYKDGKPFEYRTGKIVEPGSYILSAKDNFGNSLEYRWTIIPAAAKEYSFTIPTGKRVYAIKDGIAVSVVIDGKVVLTENGQYLLTFESEEELYTVTVIVDNVPPQVMITQEKSHFILNAPTKNNVSLELYRDGKKVDCEFGKAITTAGDYRLIVKDELGNVTVYEISLNYINMWGVALIILGAFAIVAIFAIIVLTRRRQRIK